MQPTRTQAIKSVLLDSTWLDLAELYNHDMEVQVNVAQDGGQRVEGEYQGRQWLAWTDGLSTWKSFRIPYKANSEPEYTDRPMTFDLARYVEGIGMTGWDWKNRLSRWVAYDFDAIVGHSDKHTSKLTDVELGTIQDVVSRVPWVTLRSSTSGKGLHLYVFLKETVATRNHHEHAALARAILSQLTAITGYDFQNKVDVCGSNMWVWHRKMFDKETKERIGLRILKKGEPLNKIPDSWQSHLTVIQGKSKKTKPTFIPSGEIDLFDELTGQRAKTTLDSEHKKLLNYLEENNCRWWFDQDHWMLVTHTHDLARAHNELKMKGIFTTLATGSERGQDHNCFAYPLAHGAWGVRRYSQGVKESETWEQDGRGWTKCILNRELELHTACRLFGGTEHPKGGYHFSTMEALTKAIVALGGELTYHSTYNARAGLIKPHKDDETKVIVMISATKDDMRENMVGWIQESKHWVRVVQIVVPVKLEVETANYDDIIRHLVTPDSIDCGWMLKAEGQWIDEPFTHIKAALDSMGYSGDEKKNIIGSNLFKPWRIVNLPFQSEYPGDRQWNRNAAQLRHTPSPEPSDHKHWDMVLSHCGKGLDDACQKHEWCRQNGIIRGKEYLMCWIASLIKEPTQPLPYLFLFSLEQDTGKTIFHEAIELLLSRGYMRADASVSSNSGFNGELENTVFCVIEEMDLNASKTAYNRIKDWVTSRNILIHRKNATPYMAINTTHWVHCANEPQACPMFPGDTRITMIQVPPLTPEEKIPKRELLKLLEKEAPDFLASLMRLEIPPSNDRLNIPVLNTEEKFAAQSSNETMLQRFLREKCYEIPGAMVSFADFYAAFQNELLLSSPKQMQEYTKMRVTLELPAKYPKGKLTTDPNIHIGNLTLDPSHIPTKPYVKDGVYIRRQI